MKKYSPLILFAFCFITNVRIYSQINSKIEKENESIQFEELTKRAGKKVVIFFSPDCPVCQSYAGKLNSFCDKYGAQGFSFFAVFPGKLYSGVEIKSFYGNYKFKPEQILDPEKIITNRLKATITPQVFIIDENAKVIYSGAIDDQYADIGKKRSVVSKDYLKAVIEAIIKNRTLPFVNTEPIGCLIE